MFEKRAAKNKVEDQSAANNWSNIIDASIMQGIAEKKYHCDWYSPACCNLKNKDIEHINKYVDHLKFLGYKVTNQIFLPNDTFKNTRIKLHINWE